MRAQEALGSDIIMCLDHCVAYEADKETVHRAMLLTHKWAAMCKEAHADSGQALFGIVQGGANLKWRAESAKALADMDFPGYAIGGTGVGEPKHVQWEMVEAAVEHLPREKPRYLMGIGAPEDLLEGIERGIDMFDCALPTRVARNGALFTPAGRVNIRAPRFQAMDAPLDPACDCYACKKFTAAYLSHLYRSEELLAYRLGTIHNLRFVLRLMENARQAIAEGRFAHFKASFLSEYQVTDEDTRLEQKRKWMEKRG
jgi:queuine tRNA-ribosyltransferase